ncbi:hypothetical protein BKA64DRAFT_709337 [Cadophora sp. MPI-SDFR-AT-0126]|nr:hypothetical protein BKA64DRAFT_709337 [Leotiomycetes sp. MPI-SDFR-AT-0126]
MSNMNLCLDLPWWKRIALLHIGLQGCDTVRQLGNPLSQTLQDFDICLVQRMLSHDYSLLRHDYSLSRLRACSRRKTSSAEEEVVCELKKSHLELPTALCRLDNTSLHNMPPKRRAAEPAEASTATQRPSKLAKEHNITAAEESEIKDAFEIFQETRKGEKEKVIPIQDVRRAMKALGIPPTNEENEEFIQILDPDDDGYALYSSFVAICALKFHTRSRTSDSHNKEVDEAFAMFNPKGDGKITLATLRRVANMLKEDVDDELLRRMILEANGGAGVAEGVNREEFEGIMRRAGLWR